MDCNMPFVDGYEATSTIRELLYQLDIVQPIIMAVTGQAEDKYVKMCIESGMNCVAAKPVKII